MPLLYHFSYHKHSTDTYTYNRSTKLITFNLESMSQHTMDRLGSVGKHTIDHLGSISYYTMDHILTSERRAASTDPTKTKLQKKLTVICTSVFRYPAHRNHIRSVLFFRYPVHRNLVRRVQFSGNRHIVIMSVVCICFGDWQRNLLMTA